MEGVVVDRGAGCEFTYRYNNVSCSSYGHEGFKHAICTCNVNERGSPIVDKTSLPRSLPPVDKPRIIMYYS